MSKSEILYVKGMNISESDGDELEQAVWDDSKLNAAYDKALKMANAEVAKRVAMSTNNQKGSKEDHPRNKNNKSSAKSHSSKKEHWQAGMPCRAIYDGDGLEYEAFVLRIINDKECLVRFLGYENSEIVLMNTLKPTLGKDARTLQIEQALCDKGDGSVTNQSVRDRIEFDSDRAVSVGSTERSFQKKKKHPKKKRDNRMNSFDLPDIPMMPNMDMLRNLGSADMPLPPPPPLTFPASERVDSEEQAVSSMLLSWYMSGYYTGLYQGLKRAKESRQK